MSTCLFALAIPRVFSGLKLMKLIRVPGTGYNATKKYLHRASADVGLMFTAYNLKRMLNILGPDTLRDYLTSLSGHFYLIGRSLAGTHRQHHTLPFFISN